MVIHYRERDSVGGRQGAVRYELCFGLNQYTCFVHVCVSVSVLLREILCDPSIPAQKVECQAAMDIDALTYHQTLML